MTIELKEYYQDENTILYNTNAKQALRLLDDASVDLIVTDPPYRTTPRGNNGSTGGMLAKTINKKGLVFKYNDIKPIEYFLEFFRVLKDTGHCYVMTNHLNLQEMINIVTTVGFSFIKCLIWDKGNKIAGTFYMNQFEYILFLRKGKGVKINNCGTADILQIANKKTKNEQGENLHDTEKPIELMKILIENSSQIGDLVLDPFSGIGSTLLASKALNRNSIGYEIDTRYYEIACHRLKELENKINDKN